MKEACIGGDQTFIAHDQPAKMSQPGERPLDDPPPPVPPQLPSILMGRTLVVPPRWNDGLNAPTGQPGTQRVAVIPAVGNQPLGPLPGTSGLPWPADRDRLKGRLEERDFRRGCRLQVCSQRSTRAIDQNHPLRPLAAFRLADLGPPFLAGMKLPSAKHSSQRNFCSSLSWARKARHSSSSRPVSSHCLSRRQQVLGLPYRRGSSLHCAPVQRIQRMPSKQRRSSMRGRPPREEVFGGGRWTRIASHCAFVSRRHAMCCPPSSLGNAWRYHTSSSQF
jgi:hypothetical protein